MNQATIAEPLTARRPHFGFSFGFDPILIALLSGTVIIGLSMLWSASYFRAEQLYGEPLRFVVRQAVWVTIGTGLMVVTMVLPLTLVRSCVPALVGISLLLGVLTFVPGLSAQYLGARRWIIVFNYSFQPSEFMKVTLVLYLAHILARRGGTFSDPLHHLAPPLLVAVAFAGIVLLQNDFSTAIFLLAVALLLLYAAGVPIAYFTRMFLVAAPITLITLFTREHRVRRVITFLRPGYDPAGSGYQVLAARRALSSGGLWGAGIGQGTHKLGALPEPQSDFLFAVVGEELGFAGVLAAGLLFAAFSGRGLYLAARQTDPFRSLLLFGGAAAIALQSLMNIAVVAGAIPATGIPLPFFSSGGSAALSSFLLVGLMLNGAHVAPREHGDG